MKRVQTLLSMSHISKTRRGINKFIAQEHPLINRTIITEILCAMH